MLYLIAGITFSVLGILAYVIIQMPESPLKKKKEKKGPPPEPPKDWPAIAERLEKRLHAGEAKLQEAEKALRQKDKDVAASRTALAELEQRFQQEQTWRKKEEAAVDKEKKREKLLDTELEKAREGLTSESTQRIKLEYEVKELRLQKESSVADARRLAAQVADLERKVKAFSEENRDLKRVNAELKVKKEANQWIAKDDFIRVEKLLKRARWEVELFKKKFAEDLWPKELAPGRRGPSPMSASAEPDAAPTQPPPSVPEEAKPAASTSSDAPSVNAPEPPLNTTS